MSQSVERINARHAVDVIVAWAKSEQDRLWADELAQLRDINSHLPFHDPIDLFEGEDG